MSMNIMNNSIPIPIHKYLLLNQPIPVLWAVSVLHAKALPTWHVTTPAW